MRDLEKIPAISIRHGAVVLARGEEYVPLSRFDGRSHDPVKVVGELAVDNGKVMMLDLDAIEGRPPQMDTLQSLPSNIEMWLDAGARTEDDLYDLFMTGAERVVVSTKSIPSMDRLESMLAISDQLMFEVVIERGMVQGSPFTDSSPAALVAQAMAMGCSEFMITTLSTDFLNLDWLPDDGNFYISTMEWNDSYAASGKVSGRIVRLGEVLGIG